MHSTGRGNKRRARGARVLQLEFRTYIYLFAVSVTAHNLEEAIFLPAWAMSVGISREPSEFIFAVSILTLLVYVAAFYSIKRGLKGGWTYFITGYALAMLLNVFFPHVLASVYFRDYAPGTASAIFLILPTAFMVIYKAIRGKHVDKLYFCIIGPVVVLAILGSIPVLFASYRLLSS
jgi:hypothetical protein